MNAKKLHKHALPVISVAIAGLAISSVSAAALASGNQPSRNILANSLTSQAVTVQVGSNGLATLKPAQPATASSAITSSNDLSSSALWYIALHPAQ